MTAFEYVLLSLGTLWCGYQIGWMRGYDKGRDSLIHAFEMDEESDF